MDRKIPPVSAATTTRAITALEEAFALCTTAALRSARTMAALDYLDVALAGHWSVDQFRRSTGHDNDTARWQNCNASLNAIKLAREATSSGC